MLEVRQVASSPKAAVLRRDFKHHAATFAAVLAGSSLNGGAVNISFGVKGHAAIDFDVMKGPHNSNTPLFLTIGD